MTENLELVRSIYADWGRRDFGSTEWAHRELEYVRVDGPAPGSWTGFAEIAQAWRDMASTWDGFRITPEECRELDRERVLVLVAVSGRGKRSGMEADQLRQQAAQIFDVSGGKVERIVTYYDRENTLAMSATSAVACDASHSISGS